MVSSPQSPRRRSIHLNEVAKRSAYAKNIFDFRINGQIESAKYSLSIYRASVWTIRTILESATCNLKDMSGCSQSQYLRWPLGKMKNFKNQANVYKLDL